MYKLYFKFKYDAMIKKDNLFISSHPVIPLDTAWPTLVPS